MVTDPPNRIKYALVTGATGIVGYPLCRHLADAGARVTAYSRSLENFTPYESVSHVSGDILDADALKAAATGCDVIFHVAAAVHGSASGYDEFRRINVDGTANVVALAEELTVKLVHVSTVNVAGYQSGELTDAYAATKSDAEDIVREAIGNGLDGVIVRPATVFGSEKGRAGLLVDRLFAGSLKILPAPSRKISPVWAQDLCRALIGAANSTVSNETITVAGPSMTTGQFVDSVCAAAGIRKPLMPIPAWLFAIPLQLAWWSKGFSRWTPPVSVESLMNGSVHDGREAAEILGFEYTPISEIFSGVRT